VLIVYILRDSLQPIVAAHQFLAQPMTHYPLIRFVSSLTRPAGMLVAALSAMVLAAHPLGVEILFRPLAGGPATHPLTATALLLLSLPLACWRHRQNNHIALPMALAALAIGALRLADIAFDTRLLEHITPFQDAMDAQIEAGRPIKMGLNTALMTVFLAVALILEGRRYYLPSQLFAFLGLGFPAVAATGYAYGLANFHGQMALSTVALASLAGIGILTAGAHRGVLKAMLSPWMGGRIARVQVILAYLVPFAIGYVLVTTVTASATQLFGLFVVIVSGFIVVLVTVSAVFQEHVDRRRRGAERLLSVAATIDPLTETANRRLLLQTAMHEVERANRHGQPLSLLMVDIDHFKQLNDRYGHAAGDAVLRTIARAMQATLRKQDLLARYGGEEFVVVLPDTPVSGAAHLAEKIRTRIEGTLFPENVDRVTVSVGCSDNRNTSDFRELLIATDKALYAAKALGRNRVEVASGDDGAEIVQAA
jgi:diguanylate cyclase (GGDEF)-like protein